MCGVTRIGRIRNKLVTPVTEKLLENRLSWYGYVMQRNEDDAWRKVLSMYVGGYKTKYKPTHVYAHIQHSLFPYSHRFAAEMTTIRKVW